MATVAPSQGIDCTEKRSTGSRVTSANLRPRTDLLRNLLLVLPNLWSSPAPPAERSIVRSSLPVQYTTLGVVQHLSMSTGDKASNCVSVQKHLYIRIETPLIRIDKDCGLPLLSPPSHISVPTGTSALGESSLLRGRTCLTSYRRAHLWHKCHW
jgi:hypothetical protein